MAGTAVLNKVLVPKGSIQLQTTAQVNKLVTDIETVRLGASQSTALNSGGLKIHGSSSTLAATANDIYAFLVGASGAAGSFKKFAAADLAALSGTVTNTKWGIWFFTWDGTTQAAVLQGGGVASLAAVPLPTFAATKACFGCVIINPTGTGDFVGGTTALDDGTVVPNAVYVNFTGEPNLTASQVASGLTAATIQNDQGVAVTYSNA